MPFAPQRVLLLTALLFAPACLHAQAEDGGVTYDNHGQELLESVNVPSIPDAPFSLTLATEWARLQRNGGTFTIVNSRPIKRDSAGRIYMERWLLSPKGSGIPSRMSWIQIEDPVAHTYYECSATQHFCDLTTARPTPLGPDPSLAKSGTLRSGKGTHTHEDLGRQFFAGLPVHGYRETTSLNAGTFGNDLAMTTVREFLYSPELGLNLSSVLDTPQFGRQSFTVTEITTTEPDPKFFLPPPGYAIRDHRHPPAPRPGDDGGRQP